MADVFLSYKREERAAVERLATALRGLGLDVWFDASLSAGEAFSDEIDREVRAARVVLVCWSPLAASSQWVKAEAQVGFTRQNLISTYVSGPDGFEPPVPFNGLHMEDMRSWAQRPSARDAAWLSIMRRLGSLVGRADIAEWGALGASATTTQIESWLDTHAARSPLVLDAESFLREREAEDRERAAAEAAVRERVERLRAEKAAAEANERERAERLRAEEAAVHEQIMAARLAEIAQRELEERQQREEEQKLKEQEAVVREEQLRKGAVERRTGLLVLAIYVPLAFAVWLTYFFVWKDPIATWIVKAFGSPKWLRSIVQIFTVFVGTQVLVLMLIGALKRSSPYWKSKL